MNKGWQYIKVSEFAEVVGGGTPKTNIEQYWNGIIPWVSPSDLTGYSKVYISKGAKNITDLGLSSSSTKLLPKNTVLLSSRAPIGYVAIATNPICTNQGFRSLVCDEEKMIPLFLYYALKVYKPTLEAYATGATFPEVSGSALKKISLPVPSLDEQITISNLLISYDNLIANNTKRIAILEEMAEQIYKEWFVRMRFPGYEDSKFIKGTPQNWQPKRFDEFVTLKRGLDLPNEKMKDGIYPVVASTSIKGFHNEFKAVPPIVVTGRSGSLGMVQYIEDKCWPLNTSLYSTNFHGNSPRYVFFILKGLKLENFNSGAGVPTLNRNHLSSLKLNVPPHSLQKKFNELISPLFEEINLLAQKNINLIKSRDLLLPRLISGKLSVAQASQKLQEAI